LFGRITATAVLIAMRAVARLVRFRRSRACRTAWRKFSMYRNGYALQTLAQTARRAKRVLHRTLMIHLRLTGL
jgi:hypothetical protein